MTVITINPDKIPAKPYVPANVVNILDANGNVTGKYEMVVSLDTDRTPSLNLKPIEE